MNHPEKQINGWTTVAIGFSSFYSLLVLLSLMISDGSKPVCLVLSFQAILCWSGVILAVSEKYSAAAL
jgi:hypothetical protein